MTFSYAIKEMEAIQQRLEDLGEQARDYPLDNREDNKILRRSVAAAREGLKIFLNGE